MTLTKKIARRLADIFAAHGPDAFDRQSELLLGSVGRIFDVGSNAGESIDRYLKTFPKAEIHAFEPLPESFRVLEQKYRGEKNIFLNNVALSDAPSEKKTMFLTAAKDSSSLHEVRPDASEHWQNSALDAAGSVDVRVETLDNYCRSKNIDGMDILKIDVQGHEMGVLKGAHGLFGDKKIKLVFVEVLFISTYIEQSTASEVMDFFNHNGFYLADFFAMKNKTRVLQSDFIFMRG